MAAARLRRLPAWFLPVLALLALAAALLWLPPAEPAQAQDGQRPTITAGPVIASSPASGDTYGQGETIEVTVTFSESVTVTGEPRVRLDVGERKRWARYSSADGATLTFAYTVKKADADPDGVSIPKNAVKADAGTIADGDGNAAHLKHPALADQAGHKVNGSPEEPAEPEPTPTPTPEPAPANSEPQFDDGESATRSVDENAAIGASVGAALAATDADNDALTYAHTGSGAFAVGASTGQITVAGALDHETQSSYSLTVIVSDGRNAAGEADASVDDTIAVTVTIGNVDEAGAVSLESEKDPPQAGSPVSASLSDPDGVVEGSVTWQWKRSPEGTTAQNVDTTNFDDIAGATGATYTPVEGDQGRWLRVKATYADAFGSGKGARVQTANPVAAAPEQPGQQQRAANRPPQFAADSAEISVDENASIRSNVGDPITATDADGDALSYALTGSEAFLIDRSSGQITVDGTLDYETRSSYSLTVTVSDGRNAAGEADDSVDDSIAVTVNIGNVDEPGTVSLNTQSPKAGSALTARVSDPEGVVEGSVTWQWKRSPEGTTAQNVDTTNFDDIAGATGATYTPVEGDQGRWLRVKATYADAFGSGKGARVQTANPVTVAGPARIIAGPFISSRPESGDTYGEGETIVVALTFSERVWVEGLTPWVILTVGEREWWVRYSYEDAGETTLTFPYEVKKLDIDADGVSVVYHLQIDSDTIVNVDGDAVDLEHSTLPDQAGHKVLGSPNSPARFAAPTAARSVDDGAAIGAKVGGPVTATDADKDSLTYALSGSGAFAIDAHTGQITVAAALDHETQSSYSLRVTVSDGSNAFGAADAGVDDAITVTVSVGNADQPGFVSLLSDYDPPLAGDEVRAYLLDPDVVAGAVAWTWQRSSDGETWEVIAGATGATYTATEDDAGYYLRATAAYADGLGLGKTAQGALSGQVLTPPEPQRQRQGTPDNTPPTHSVQYFGRIDPTQGHVQLFSARQPSLPTLGTVLMYAHISFSEAIDESQTTIRYRVGSGRERTFTFGAGPRVAGECDNFRGSEYNCAYKPTPGERGLFRVRVSAYKDTAGNAGTPGRYNTNGFTVDTRAPAAPKLVLKNPASSSPGDVLGNVAPPEFTATLSEGTGELYLWQVKVDCGRFRGAYRQTAAVDVDDSAPPYTVDITAPPITSDGAVTYWAMQLDEHFNQSDCVRVLTYTYDGPTPPAKPGSAASGGFFTADRGPGFAHIYGGNARNDDYATLTWNNPGDPTIAKYQYRYEHVWVGNPFDSGGNSFDSEGYRIDSQGNRLGSEGYVDSRGNRIDITVASVSPWIDIPGSGPDTTTHTVRGLEPAYDYRFQLRAVDTMGNEGPEAYANHGPQWVQGGWYGGEMTPRQYKNSSLFEQGQFLAKALFYDVDGDWLIFHPEPESGNTLGKCTDSQVHRRDPRMNEKTDDAKTDGELTRLKCNLTFHLDGEGRIITTGSTRQNLNWSVGSRVADYYVTVCVKAQEERDPKDQDKRLPEPRTRCITIDFVNKNWPNDH
ncbi:MAG: hypothetical protein F4X66_07560 [Chloroflexi bacterium]|nr:hypothetical protein [Chloroflexota bacterium]MYE39844.1 hypothetical protein [Chloroflexota bacterium]